MVVRQRSARATHVVAYRRPVLSRISEEPNPNGPVAGHGDGPSLARAVVTEGLAIGAQEHETVDVVRAGLELVDDLCKTNLQYFFLLSFIDDDERNDTSTG